MSSNMTNNEEKKTILWIVNVLDGIGGGERLLLEGARHYRSLGHRVIIVTWHFNEEALFDGEYENKDIISLEGIKISRVRPVRNAYERLKKLIKLRKIINENDVDVIFTQGEYDVALLYLTTLGLRIPYRFLIFGQTYQYVRDNAKYSFLFKEHLETIVNSCPGYRDTIPLKKPKLNLVHNIMNELICLIRLFAVRKAEKCFSFSKQVQWETHLLFNVKTEIACGAYRLEHIKDYFEDKNGIKNKFNLNDQGFLLSLCRLHIKKRVDLIIKSYAKIDSILPLVIGGIGSEQENLETLVESLGLTGRVIFIGRVDDVDMLPLKAMAKMFVSMDIADFDISPLEALAVGTKVICPVEFDVDDYLKQRSDFVIVEPNIDDVVKGMNFLLDDNFQENVAPLDRYSWEQYFDQLLT